MAAKSGDKIGIARGRRGHGKALITGKIYDIRKRSVFKIKFECYVQRKQQKRSSLPILSELMLRCQIDFRSVSFNALNSWKR